LFDEPLVVVAGTDSPWTRRRNVAFADLIAEPWLLAQPGSLARLLQDELFRANGLETPTAQVVTVSLHLLMRLIESGRWLGLIPASVVRFAGQRMLIKVLPVKALSPPAPVGLITVRGRMLTPLAERFIDCTRKVAKANSSGTQTSRRPARR
jgi:DNA-binding transcriptional LysR family regulator